MQRSQSGWTGGAGLCPAPHKLSRNINSSLQSQFYCVRQGASLGSKIQKKLSEPCHAPTCHLTIFLTNGLRQNSAFRSGSFVLPKIHLTHQAAVKSKRKTQFRWQSCTSSPLVCQQILTFPAMSVGQVVIYPKSKTSHLFKSLDISLPVMYISLWLLQLVRNLVFHFSTGLAHLGASSTQNPRSPWTQFHSTTSDCKFPRFLDKCIPIYFGEKKEKTHTTKHYWTTYTSKSFSVLDHLLSHVSNTCASREIAGLANQNLKVPKNPQNHMSSRSPSH